MKYLLIVILFLLTINLFSNNYIGEWKINTMGAGNSASISQNKKQISVFRIIKQQFEGEEYILYHLMKGNLNDKKLKLYVKEDKLDKFEYLRDVSFEKKNLNELKIDGKLYLRKDIINNTNKQDDTRLAKDSDNNNEKVEIIYLKKEPNNKENVADKNEPSFILPAGLGDKDNKELRKIKISLGFTTEENNLNMKAIRLIKRKHYNKAIKIFLSLYKKNEKNISLLIKIENTYSLVGNKKEAKKYCIKIKKYDPFYLCGD